MLFTLIPHRLEITALVIFLITKNEIVNTTSPIPNLLEQNPRSWNLFCSLKRKIILVKRLRF